MSNILTFLRDLRSVTSPPRRRSSSTLCPFPHQKRHKFSCVVGHLKSQTVEFISGLKTPQFCDRATPSTFNCNLTFWLQSLVKKVRCICSPLQTTPRPWYVKRVQPARTQQSLIRSLKVPPHDPNASAVDDLTQNR